MQAAPYSGTSSVRTISNDGCSTTFIVFDVAGEAADKAEEEASTVLPRHVVVDAIPDVQQAPLRVIQEPESGGPCQPLAFAGKVTQAIAPPCR